MDGNETGLASSVVGAKGGDVRAVETALIAGLYDDLNAGRIEPFIERLAPDVDFVPLPLFRRSRCHGHDGVRSWWPHRRELRIAIEIERIDRDAEGRYGVEGSVEVAGVESPFAGIIVVEAGKIAYLRHYFSDLATLSGLGEWSSDT